MVFVYGVLLFMFGIVLALTSHTSQISVAERQANGNQAMIYAVCDAFHTRDKSWQAQWRSISDIEYRFKLTNKTSADAGYHAARRVAFQNAVKADAELLAFDCRGSMRKTFIQGALSASAPNLNGTKKL